MLQSSGFTVDKFYIPPFTVHAGEIVIIELPNGAPFIEVMSKVVNLLTGKEEDPNVTVTTDFRFVNHIIETGWIRFFRPMTVGRYVKLYGNPLNKSADKVYSLCDLKPNTEIRRMPGNHRKLLSMLTTLSWTNRIIFDLIGVDPTGGELAYGLAKETAANGGAVVLLDNYGDFKNDCTRYLKYQVIGKPAT
jgi:hypothetical protein